MTEKEAKQDWFTAETEDAIARLSDGELLAEIAEDIGVKRTTLYMRFQGTPQLADAYARAREAGLHARGERLRRLSSTPLPTLPNGAIDPGAVAQLRLQVDAEKWTLSKLLPKVFGDKVEQTVMGANGGPLQIEKIERVIIDKPEAK